MTILELVRKYNEKMFMNTKQGAEAKSEWLKKELEIKTYIPFREKREIAEVVVRSNITVVDGVKKYDSINGYIGLIISAIVAHTNLQFGNDPIADYDLLAESGMLNEIIAEFNGSYNEIDILMHMVLDMELEDNDLSVSIAGFLNKIASGLDGMFKDFDLKKILGNDIKEEDITKILSFVNKLK